MLEEHIQSMEKDFPSIASLVSAACLVSATGFVSAMNLRLVFQLPIMMGSSHCIQQNHFNEAKAKYKDCDFTKYRCVFIDSITIASKLCLAWCKNQPESFSERSGKPDVRAAYGLLASEMSSWLNQFQHIPDKDVIFVGLLDQRTDDFNKTSWIPQIEGSKISIELPGVLDEVISMVPMKGESGNLERKFVCHTLNAAGYPAKDRSGKLSEIEEAHLGKLLAKIKSANKKGE